MTTKIIWNGACVAAAAALLWFVPADVSAQKGPPAPKGQPPTPKQSAPIDLTGTWVSLVTEDWLYRMVTPAKGDVSSVPVSAAGRGAANNWDPAKDEAEGNQCKAYGAPAIMRVPGRVRI